MPKASMPKFTAAPVEVSQSFTSAVSHLPGVESRKMFGYPAGFVGGNMFAGVFGDSIILRLPEEERSEIVGRRGGAPFEPMPGRVMREYVVVPAALMADAGELVQWLEKARAFAAGLPAKKKPPKAGKKRK